MCAWEVQRAVESIARRQHGVFAATQAEDVGATRGIIGRQVRSKAWIRLGPGIYAVAAVPASWLRAAKAAELSSPGAVVSHGSSLVLHGIPGFRPGSIHITVESTGNARNRLAIVHRSNDPVPTEIADGVRVVSVEHALVSMAGRASFSVIADAMDGLLLDRRATLASLRERQSALAPGHPRGSGVMRALLADRDPGTPAPESELERLLARMLRMVKAPGVVLQSPPPWRPSAPQRLDAVIPAWRLVVEADGRRWHARVADFERDRERDNEAVAHGYRVQRFTWAHLASRPDDAARQLTAAGQWVVQAA